MRRVVVIGNSGGGKSTLARRLAAQPGCPCVEVDALLWQQGWRLAPVEVYNAEHARLIAGEQWIIDGLGRHISQRLSRSTDIVLIDMPLWMHFWLAPSGSSSGLPATSTRRPPASRRCRERRHCEKRVARLGSVSDLENFGLPGQGNSN